MIDATIGAMRRSKALSIHGRHQEVAQVCALLGEPECALVTLAGPAGIGKTSLAAAVAAASNLPTVEVSFEDCGSLCGRHQAGRIESALAAVNTDNCLLVLNSVDELAGGAAVVAALLCARPSLRVLVTSRYPLELAQEWTVRVRGLEFRSSGKGANSNALSLTCAAQLFVECACTRIPGFNPGADQRIINLICARLEGSPLGISLAAGLVGVYPISEIARRLTDDLDFLSTPEARRPRRHASIRGAMDSCWRQLNQEQRKSFARLSVFVGGFDAGAALRIAHCSRKTLATLVEHSWLRLECMRTTVRYTIHPLLRRYGLRKLAGTTIEADPLTRDLERRHAMFYRQLLHAQSQALGAIDDESFYQIDLEHQNLRQAWIWLKTHCVAPEVIHFVDTFHLYCIHRNHRQEASQLLESALTLKAIPVGQVGRWQHLLAETRSASERIHSAERRRLPRVAVPDTASARSRWLKSLAPPPGAVHPNLIQL